MIISFESVPTPYKPHQPLRVVRMSVTVTNGGSVDTSHMTRPSNTCNKKVAKRCERLLKGARNQCRLGHVVPMTPLTHGVWATTHIWNNYSETWFPEGFNICPIVNIEFNRTSCTALCTTKVLT
jgi:hypothetical protein